jgi:hypothetical protein
MKKHLFLILLCGLNFQILLSQTPTKVENMQLFTDVFHTYLNDSVMVEKYDVAGVITLKDTSNVKRISVIVYSVNIATNEETVTKETSTNLNLLYVTNDNSIPGFFIEDSKVFFTVKAISDIKDKYVRFKVLNNLNTTLDTISSKLSSTN